MNMASFPKVLKTQCPKALKIDDISFIIYKKLQAIYLMLYKRYKTAKTKKYKHEHVLAYTFNLSSVARINV